MLPFKLIYHEGYDLNLGSHVFPRRNTASFTTSFSPKGWRALKIFSRRSPPATRTFFASIRRITCASSRPAHSADTEELRLEVPYSKELVEGFWLAAGGSILAGQRALADGWAANIGGGFHHACPDHGEGFCAIHDVAVAIRRLQFDRAIEHALVVDTDVHQGNGTAEIFGGDGTVYTLSLHQEHNYPHPKARSTVDVNLPDGMGDDDYLAVLEKSLHRAFQDFSPQILFYVAGADPYREDQLGGLKLTIEGLARRDALVCDYARRHRVPLAISEAGGYARRVEDTVRIHINTILAARDAALAGKQTIPPSAK